MKDLIFIAGAPGSGKTTVSSILSKRLNNSPLIDFGEIRVFHLNKEWSNADKKEEQMSFENLVFILKNYLKNGYKNVIINDLQNFRVQQIPNLFRDTDYLIISLVLDNEQELEKRVVSELRDSGFRNIEEAKLWNRDLKSRAPMKNEFKIENSHNNPEQTVNSILELVEG